MFLFGKLWQLQILLQRPWRWWTKLDYEMPSLHLYRLEHGIGIHGFRPTETYLIVKVLITRVKFLQLATVLWLIVFTFRTTDVFTCIRDVVAKFQLLQDKFLIKNTLHVHYFGFRIAKNEIIHNMLADQISQYYPPQQVPASVTWYMPHELARTKI